MSSRAGGSWPVRRPDDASGAQHQVLPVQDRAGGVLGEQVLEGEQVVGALPVLAGRKPASSRRGPQSGTAFQRARARTSWQRRSRPGRPIPMSSGRNRGSASISTTARRPPGRIPAWSSRSSRSGAASSCSEEAAQARSTAPTSGQAVSRSACTVRIRSDGPGAPAAARSRSSLGADRSIATICADGKRRARSRLPAPVPAPMSATVSGVPRTCWPTQSSTSSSSGPRISASSSSSSASPSSSCCSGWVWCPAVGCGESCGVMPPR